MITQTKYRKYDSESDYYAMGFRMYSAEFGRFLAVDPLFEAMPRHNPYHYSYNSPLFWSDPSGLAPVKEKVKNSEKLLSLLTPIEACRNFQYLISQEQSTAWGYLNARLNAQDIDEILKGPSAYEIMESHFGGASGAAGSGVNGTISFTYQGTQYNNISKSDLTNLLSTLFESKFLELDQISQDKNITDEYGFDIWIDENGELQSNDVAVRNDGNANYYFPDIPDGMTYLSTAHTHWGMDGTFSSNDLNGPLFASNRIKTSELFVGFVIHRDGISAFTYDKSIGANAIRDREFNSVKLEPLIDRFEGMVLNNAYSANPSGVYNAWNDGIKKYFLNFQPGFKLYIFHSGKFIKK